MSSDWVLLSYSNKLVRNSFSAHSADSLNKSEGEWFVKGLHLMAQWVVKKLWKYLNTNNYDGTHFMIKRERGIVWLMLIFSYSILACWLLEILFSYSSTLQLNLISQFHSIKSVKIPLEILIWDQIIGMKAACWFRQSRWCFQNAPVHLTIKAFVIFTCAFNVPCNH